MRGLLLILMLLVCFNVVLVPIALVQASLPAETTFAATRSTPRLVLINGTTQPNDPGSGGGAQGTI
jgi:hypothetical protein